MNTTTLFTAALGLTEPWYVTSTDFKDATDGSKELHIYIDFQKGSHFECPMEGCSHSGTAYDTTEHIWRHLNFFQFKTYIHAWQPRIHCPDHKTHLVPVPWAREGSGFTLLFEAMCLELAKAQPMVQVDGYDTRLWRFVKHYIFLYTEKRDYPHGIARSQKEYRRNIRTASIYNYPGLVPLEEKVPETAGHGSERKGRPE